MYPDTCFFNLVSNYSSAAIRFMSSFLKSKETGDRIDGDNLKDNGLGNSSPLIAVYSHHAGNGTEAFKTSGNVSSSTCSICELIFTYGQEVY
jgi:hypothetical protein